jgi:hypothetical protein
MQRQQYNHWGCEEALQYGVWEVLLLRWAVVNSGRIMHPRFRGAWALLTSRCLFFGCGFWGLTPADFRSSTVPCRGVGSRLQYSVFSR